jgi:glycosyltransferase involved in cell wall biosynthesis
MKVTVVVRTYNRPEFLKEALASIHLQTHTDWEVLIFDDGATNMNFDVYRHFKSINLDKRILYLTTNEPYDLFGNSWLIAPDVATGELIVRLDDDDLLAKDSLEFLSNLYEQNPELEFSYGSCARFDKNQITEIIQTSSPNEIGKTRDAWAAYTIPNNHPWGEPWAFYKDFYAEPQNWTSIIHCAKSNIMCIFHTYVMRTSAVKRVKDKITITSNFVDDLEMMGSLDYLGLGHASVKKILTYVRTHNQGRVTDNGKEVNGANIYGENFRIRDKVDHLRTSGFISKVIPLSSTDNFNNGITDKLKEEFDIYYNRIKEL